MENNFKVALITGATGYIGSQLAKYLVNKGIAVHIICRNQSNLKNIQSIIKKISIYRYDENKLNMDKIMQQANPDVVFHLASDMGVESTTLRSDIIVSNVKFGVELLDAMHKYGVNKFINTGTHWQNYNQFEYSPVNFSAATTQAFQDILNFYSEVLKIKIITLKLYEVYGSNDDRNKIVNLLKNSSLNNVELLLSPGDQYLSLVHIDDVISCYINSASKLCSNSKANHEIYSIYSKELIKLKDLVMLVEKEINKKLNIKWGGRPYRAREIMIPVPGKLIDGWAPKISLEDGLKKVFSNG
jgi:nucleoside-diphosphate-sugar epimerase